MTAPGQEDGWLDSAYEERYEANEQLDLDFDPEVYEDNVDHYLEDE